MGNDTTDAEERAAAEEAAEAEESAAEASEDEASESETGQGDDEGEGTSDKHGHPSISRGKYERDMEAKDAKIAELEQKLGEATKSAEAREKLEGEIADLKAQMASDKVTYTLEAAGCRNVKAAKAVLEDYDGDVSKLKEEIPYLFEQKKSGSTGGKPAGATKGEDEKLDRAFGLK